MDRKYIMALDQGTTSSRAILFDKEGNVVATSQKEFTQFYPKIGWVEHNPMEIWGSQSGVMREVLETNSIRPEEVCAIGITNQRETTIVWEKSTGKPIYNAIVWQCRRTSEICDELAKEDSRIRVFHKENGGLGSARNVGIDNAQGEFIYFFDVDDSLEKSFISDSVQYAYEKKADMIIYGYYARFSNSNAEEKICVQEREIHSNEELKNVYCNELLWLKHGNGFAWNKFYRVSFVKKYHFHFGNQRIQQDEPFNMQLYLKLENVYVCPKVYYHYVLYIDSNAGSRYIENKETIITDVYHRFMSFYEEWNLQDNRVLTYIKKRYISGIFGIVTENYFHKNCGYTKKQKYEKISNIFENVEFISVLENTKIKYGRNPVNNVQIWAFNHKKVKLLIEGTKLKKYLKKKR